MKARLLFSVLLALGLAACGGAAAPASSAPGTSAKPAASGSAKWDELVAAAKKEGTLTLAVGPGGGPSARQTIPPAFKQDFGIDVQILVSSAPDLLNKAKLEQSAGQHSVDMLFLGADTMYNNFYGEHLIDPIKPVLVNPEALDPSAWPNGKPWFMDPDDAYILRVSNGLSGFVTVNTKYINPSEITSWQDLLKPQYKGKIVTYDPTINGTGAQHAAFVDYRMGDDFLRQLYKGQAIAYTQNTNQFSDWLGQGKYPIALAMPGSDVERLKKDGLPVQVVPAFKENPGYITAGSGLLAMIKGAPHPNAAALFANWMAMDRGQRVWNESQGYSATRISLKNEWMPEYMRPKPGVDYLDTYGWDYVETTYPSLLKKVRQLLGAQ